MSQFISRVEPTKTKMQMEGKNLFQAQERKNIVRCLLSNNLSLYSLLLCKYDLVLDRDSAEKLTEWSSREVELWEGTRVARRRRRTAAGRGGSPAGGLPNSRAGGGASCSLQDN